MLCCALCHRRQGGVGCWLLVAKDIHTFEITFKNNTNEKKKKKKIFASVELV
jgi:hypothetical protein